MSARTLRRVLDDSEAYAETEALREVLLDLLRNDREVRAAIAALTRQPRSAPITLKGGRRG